jgi:hypothetical protein
MIDRGLVLLLAGCALFGAIIVVELVFEDADGSAGAPIARRPETGTVPRAQGPHVDELLTTILDRPLFSPTRQPAPRKSPDQPADFDLADVRLTGIVVEPGRHLAIFAVVGAKPIVRSEGETMNDWRVESITPGEVVLSGPAGRMTLQPKVDASLARPSAAPPRPGQIQPATAGPPAAGQVGLMLPAPPRTPATATPTLPGAAPPKPPSMPAIGPLGTPPPLRLPGATGGRE